METLEKNIKEVVHAGLGAYAAAQTKYNEGIDKVQSYVEDNTNKIKAFVEELELKGATDNSELGVQVKTAVKDAFGALNDAEAKAKELLETNYAKLKLELGKRDINIPALDSIGEQIDGFVDAVNGMLNGAQTKIDGLIDTAKTKISSSDEQGAA